MLVCHCAALSDRAIAKVICGGAWSVDEVAETSGAGASCGGCMPHLLRLLEEHAPDQRDVAV